MRIPVFLFRAAMVASLGYALYSAYQGQWPRATFFLVAYHVGFQFTVTVHQIR